MILAVESGVDRAPAGHALSLAEWAALPEDAPGEWVDGRLVDEEITDYLHEVVVAALVRILGTWLHGQGGFVGGSDARFAISPRRGRKPDISVYLPGGRIPRHEDSSGCPRISWSKWCRSIRATGGEIGSRS